MIPSAGACSFASLSAVSAICFCATAASYAAERRGNFLLARPLDDQLQRLLIGFELGFRASQLCGGILIGLLGGKVLLRKFLLTLNTPRAFSSAASRTARSAFARSISAGRLPASRSGQIGGLLGNIRRLQSHVICKGLQIEAGQQLAGLTAIALVHMHGRYPSRNPEAERHIANIDIAVEHRRIAAGFASSGRERPNR